MKSVKTAGIQHVGKSDPAGLKLTIQSKKPLWKNFTLGLHINFLAFFFFKGITALSHHNHFGTPIVFCDRGILFFVLLVSNFCDNSIFLSLFAWRYYKSPVLEVSQCGLQKHSR